MKGKQMIVRTTDRQTRRIEPCAHDEGIIKKQVEQSSAYKCVPAGTFCCTHYRTITCKFVLHLLKSRKDSPAFLSQTQIHFNFGQQRHSCDRSTDRPSEMRERI